MTEGPRLVVAALTAIGCAVPAPLPENRVGPARDLDRAPGQMTVFAMFDDASGLSTGAPVRVAGLEVGRVLAVSTEQHSSCRRCARVEMTLRDDLELTITAEIIKRPGTRAGEAYLEIDLGPAPATNLEPTAIHDGGEIEQVVEDLSVDEMLRRLER